jgi:anthranilate phosphoribosyltransferase
MTKVPDFKVLLAHVAQGYSLSESEAEAAFDIIMSDNATPSQMGAFLMALRMRGESVDEITGAARIMRAKALAVDAPSGTIDTCGTGDLAVVRQYLCEIGIGFLMA